MRLLKTKTPNLEFEEFMGDAPLYAILSHTWGDGEVSLQDVQRGDATAKAGYRKITKTREIAARDGFEYVWIDTCCIDKTNSAELSEAINSMYAWYQESDMCYVFLADGHGTRLVTQDLHLRFSRWFKRGWTLQELIAPSAMTFLSSSWKPIGTKSTLQPRLSTITGIPGAILQGLVPVQSASVAQRMSWAAGRETTRPEDAAYCLMGIFGISMPMLYGEGDKAFLRLQEEIMKTSDDHSIFAWANWSFQDTASGLLATSPGRFQRCGNILMPPRSSTPIGPITSNSKGIHLEVRWIRDGSGTENISVILPCVVEGRPESIVRVPLRDVSGTGEYFQRTGKLKICLPYELTGSINPAKRICVQHEQAQGDVLLLERAVRRGSKVIVKMLLERGVQLGIDTLSNAAWGGHEAIVRLLIETGVVPNSKTLYGAARGGHEAVVKLLIESGIQPTDTELSCAVRKGHEAVVRLLMESGVDSGTLRYAASEGHEAVVRLLMESGVQPDSGTLRNAVWKGHEAVVRLLMESGVQQDSGTLGHAVLGGQEAIVRLLIKSGAQPYSWDLSNAVGEGNEAIVRLLMESGVQPDSRTLGYAVQGGHEAVIRLLIESGVPPNDEVLGYAVREGQEAVLRLLIESGVQLDSRALYNAVQGGHEAVVRLLIESGVQPDSQALYSAVWEGHEAVVRLLMESGVQPDSRTLGYAVQGGHEAVIRLLIKSGVQPDSRRYTMLYREGTRRL